MSPGVWVLAVSVSFGASLLTFFSGFGLGTLLLPVFALFFPAEAAVMMTATVHLLNNLFKLSLLRGHVDWGVFLAFGVPALLCALLGAWLLLALSGLAPIARWEWLGQVHEIRPAGLAVGLLMVVFAVRELAALRRAGGWPRRWLPLGGALSGFFGGLSGHQGALRSAFLMQAGLGKEAFIATGVAIAVAVDVSRLSMYLPRWETLAAQAPLGLLAAATLAAFAGALLGRRLLHKVTLPFVYRVVGALLIVAGAAIALGLL